ncbi:MAG: 30S ribosomal protein S6 [Patescibacteria group bacterium]
MNHYELLYIVPLKMDEETVEPTIEKINSLLKELEAEITLQQNLGKRKLAYPIKQVRYGYYVLSEFNLEPTALKTIERELSLAGDVIRFQIVRKKIKTDEQVAREKALKDKIKIHKLHEESQAAVSASAAAKPVAPSATKIDDLDKKLEEILKNEIVK